MRRAFTLIEMLVVIGIIAVLAALLIPAGAVAVSSARNTAMGIELAELEKAIERYKQEKGDYPPSLGEIDVNDADFDGNVLESMYQPSLRYMSVVERHLRKCYPKITSSERAYFYTTIAPNVTGDEALVFWLSLTQNDERQPFSSAAKNYKQYFEFKEDRLIDFDGDGFPSYAPKYAKRTPYVYFEARTYLSHQMGDKSDGPQPYGDYEKYQLAKMNPLPAAAPLALVNARKQMQYINPSTFQIVCAGQDGAWGLRWDQFEPNGTAREYFPPQPPPSFPDDQPQGLKMFPHGTVYTPDDMDNLTSFSAGRRIGSYLP